MGSSTQLPSPPPVPPDLLFFHPFADPPSPVFSGVCSGLLPQELGTNPPFHFGFPIVQDGSPVRSKGVSELWVSKLKSSFQPLTKLASPSFSGDGTPTVLAPDSIILKPSQQWKGHLVAHFHGNPPSPAKIFSDLNPIWGKQGRISVKIHSKGVCLVYIPCEVTRQWVLDVGFWQSGNCSFSVTLWSPSIDLSPMKLIHASIWVLFRNIPSELWSIQGFSTIASSVGIPVHSESPSLKPFTNGVVKLKVVVELAKQRPSSVRVTDKLGNSVIVSASYPRLPPLCCSCGEYGHFQLRCPEAIVQSAPISPSVLPITLKAASALPVVDSASCSTSSVSVIPSDGTSRLKSFLPCPETENDDSTSGGWTYVVRKSKPPLPSSSNSVSQKSVHPVTPGQFAAEEELIKVAQQVIRNRHASPNVDAVPSCAPPLTRKNQRKNQRQQLYLLSTSNSDGANSAYLPSQRSASAPSSPSAGHSQSRFVPLLQA